MNTLDKLELRITLNSIILNELKKREGSIKTGKLLDFDKIDQYELDYYPQEFIRGIESLLDRCIITAVPDAAPPIPSVDF